MATPATPAPRTSRRCWPHPCRDYHDTYAHTSGEDPCACPCHDVPAGDGGCSDESPNPARAQRVNRNVPGWQGRL